eukprot:scaffold22759_cov54-Attheya_sp.AAC.4
MMQMSHSRGRSGMYAQAHGCREENSSTYSRREDADSDTSGQRYGAFLRSSSSKNDKSYNDKIYNISLIGAPGSGKSKLVWAAAEYLASTSKKRSWE